MSSTSLNVSERLRLQLHNTVLVAGSNALRRCACDDSYGTIIRRRPGHPPSDFSDNASSSSSVFSLAACSSSFDVAIRLYPSIKHVKPITARLHPCHWSVIIIQSDIAYQCIAHAWVNFYRSTLL